MKARLPKHRSHEVSPITGKGWQHAHEGEGVPAESGAESPVPAPAASIEGPGKPVPQPAAEPEPGDELEPASRGSALEASRKNLSRIAGIEDGAAVLDAEIDFTVPEIARESEEPGPGAGHGDGDGDGEDPGTV